MGGRDGGKGKGSGGGEKKAPKSKTKLNNATECFGVFEIKDLEEKIKAALTASIQTQSHN